MSSGPSKGLRKSVRRFGHRLKEAFKSSSSKSSRAGTGQSSVNTSSPITMPTPLTLNPTPPASPPPSLGVPQSTHQASSTQTTNPSQSSNPPLAVHPLPQGTRDVAGVGLKIALQALKSSTTRLPPLATIISPLIDILDLFPEAAKHRKDYKELASDLTVLVDSLGKHYQDSRSARVSDCVKNLVEAIHKQISHISQQQARRAPMRHLEVAQDIDDLIRCYRRIQMLFHQLQSNAVINTWNIVDEHLANTRLEGMHPAKQASYDSGISTHIRRRRCTPNTRISILEQLRVWANDPNGSKVYCMNGMAGTGKTTIACSLCFELESAHQLAASFFCSRALPDCREATRIIPTVAYQLARFSYPFQEVLCRVLGDDPDISTRGVLTQFQKLVCEPLIEIRDTLPTGMVVTIDALDECLDRIGAQTILDQLFLVAENLPIKFFVTCRPEHGLLDKLLSQGGVSRPVIHLHDMEQSLVQGDIEMYLSCELKSLSVPTDQIKLLAERSGRLFIHLLQ